MSNSKSVRHLQAGDVLSSGARILNRPYSSVRCPKGKLWVEVEYSNGDKKIVQWGASTTVTVQTTMIKSGTIIFNPDQPGEKYTLANHL